MAKPDSIRKFDWLYLGSLAIGLLGLVLGWDSIMTQMNEQMAAEGVALEGSVPTAAIIGGALIGTAISLALWFLISVLRIEFIKWILIVFVVYSVFSILGGLALTGFDLVQISGIISTILSIAAIAMLFRADAKAWFADKRAAKTERRDLDGGVDLK